MGLGDEKVEAGPFTGEIRVWRPAGKAGGNTGQDEVDIKKMGNKTNAGGKISE